MATKDNGKQTDTAPSPAPTTTHDDARQRAADCGREIEQVLARHRCRISAFLHQAEPVGNDGSRALISAGFGIFPLVE